MSEIGKSFVDVAKLRQIIYRQEIVEFISDMAGSNGVVWWTQSSLEFSKCILQLLMQ